MTQFQTGVGRPIYNAQEFLRVVAQSNEKLLPIVPDGIFGVETEMAVRVFQSEYALPVTGEIDNDTWDKIVAVYTEAKIYTTPVATLLFPSPSHVIREGDRADFHYPVQAMIFALAKRFDNVDGFDEISDLHQDGVVNTTKQLQALLGVDCNGELDIKCWNMLSRLYENVVAKETFDVAMGAPTKPVDEKMPIKDGNDEELAERFVSKAELVEDMRREVGEARDNMFRNGVITPRLEPRASDGQNAQGAPVPNMNTDRDAQSEAVRDNAERQIQADRRNNMDNAENNIADVQSETQMRQTQNQKNQAEISREKPKMPPLRWNFK